MAETLEVLTCTKCGGAIPFGDAPTTTCPFCGTSNEVPAPYHAMREAHRHDAESRAVAERLLRRLDKPPWMATKVLARMFDLPAIAFWLAYGIPLALYSIGAMLRFDDWIAPRLGYASPDDVPFWISCILVFGVLFVFAFTPRVLGIYANRRATARSQLLAALAAKPPTTAGGPALCRACGAPLDVQAGSLLAVCSYCRVENAVQLHTGLVAAAERSVSSLAISIRDAAAKDREQRRHTRRLLLRELFRYTWPTVFFGASFAFTDTPTIGPILNVAAGLMLIVLVIAYGARDRDDDTSTKNDATERRAGNDAPGWLAIAGPVVVWAFYIYGPRFL